MRKSNCQGGGGDLVVTFQVNQIQIPKFSFIYWGTYLSAVLIGRRRQQRWGHIVGGGGKRRLLVEHWKQHHTSHAKSVSANAETASTNAKAQEQKRQIARAQAQKTKSHKRVCESASTCKLMSTNARVQVQAREFKSISATASMQKRTSGNANARVQERVQERKCTSTPHHEVAGRTGVMRLHNNQPQMRLRESVSLKPQAQDCKL